LGEQNVEDEMGGERGMPVDDGKYIMGGKPKEHRKRRLDNIKMELNDIRCESVVWIN
jgi:hypothetical protein